MTERADQHRVVRLSPGGGRDWPLWESPLTARRGNGRTAPETYGLSDGLSERLAVWNRDWEQHAHPERGRDAAAAAERWSEQGGRLALELASELDGVADVSYEPWPGQGSRIYLSGRDVLVRPCEQSDVPGLTAAEPPGADIAVRRFARQQRQESVYLLALVRGTVVGGAELMLGHAPELRGLHVDEASREQGVGTAIVRAAEQARSGGRLTLWVGLANTRARRLYERLGYVGTGDVSATTYSYVDDDGPHEVTETDERLVKRFDHAGP